MATEYSVDTVDQAAVLRALGDPHRLAILVLLANGPDPLGVCDLSAHLPLAQPTVSHHLKVLANAGLVERQQSGRLAFYSVQADRLAEIGRAIQELSSQEPAAT